MGIFSTLFGKKKGDKTRDQNRPSTVYFEEPRERRHQQRRQRRNSTHSDEEEHIHAYAQSVGRRMPKGSKSCTGAEMAEDEENRMPRIDIDRRMSSRGHINRSSEGLRSSRREMSGVRRFEIDSGSDEEKSAREKIIQDLRREMKEKEEKLKKKYEEMKTAALLVQREKDEESRRNKK
ncbi:hypothetical protein PMAYCL1PPCAC_25485, partial [Pristionchus mayeri]